MTSGIQEIQLRLGSGKAKPVQGRLFVIEENQVKILGSRCPECGSAAYPVRTYCPKCLAEMREARFGPRGTVFTYTTVYQSTKDYKGETPYTLVKVLLDGVCPFTSHLVGSPPDKIKIGMEVELALVEFFQDQDGVAVVAPVFQLVDR